MALLPALVAAQNPFFMGPADDGGGSSKPAWQQFKLPKKTMKLDFRNANPDLVLSAFTKASGITIVKDPALTQPLTINTANAVSLSDAFQVLSTSLDVRGFLLKKEGNLLVIRAKPPQSQRPAFDMSQFQGLMGGQQQERTELKVYPIQFANASAVARVINEVFGDSSNLPGQNNPFQFTFGGGQGRNGRQGIQFGGGGRGNQSAPTVKASSDDFSNSVIVNAPSKQQDDVSDLIKKIDKQTDEPTKPVVYKLQYASSDALAPIVQNVLTQNAPKGRGGVGTNNIPIDQRFQQAARFGSSQAAFGTVTSDTRTNSLVVSATPDNQKLVAQLVSELDTQTQMAESTFVLPLDNAKADTVAQLLNQAFGSRTGGGAQNQNQNRNNNNNQNRNNFNNQNRGGGGGGGIQLGGGGRSAQSPQANNVDPNELPIALQDPNALSGDLQTNVGVQGGIFGFFGGGGQQGRQGQNTGIQQSRGPDGRLVNVRDLSGQVTAIADVNTNSIIVVTLPENVDMIRNIISQLDRIPEQVMIETIISEATLDNTTKLGVEWSFVQGRAFGTPGATGNLSSNFGVPAAITGGFRYSLSAGNLTALFQALKTDQRFQILSTPRIFTSNNQPAEINVSQQVPYVVSTRTDVNGNISYDYSFENVGIVLNVTPRITSNGYVSMDITQQANDLQGFTSFNAPIVNQREAQTSVSVKDGETIILGGMIRSTVTATTNKIPLLGDIPILGNLFKSTSHQKAKTELLVFLTPHVVRSSEEAKKLREDQQKELAKPTQDTLKGVIKENGKGGGTTPPKEGGN